MTEKEFLASLSAKANNQDSAESENNTQANSTENNSEANTPESSNEIQVDSLHLNAENENKIYNPDEEYFKTQTGDGDDDSDILDLSEDMIAEKGLQIRQSSEVAENETPAENNEEEENEDEKPMTLLDHLKELRKRLTKVVILVLIGFFACYPISEIAYNYLSLPLQINMPEGSSLIYTSPAGAFFVYLKISLVLSFFLSSPFSFYQIWAFVAPGLYKEEKKVLMPLAFFSAFFFISGAAFCYFLVFPIAFEFFMGFATDAIIPMISIEEYLSFVLKLLIAFGLVFEMPLFAFFLGRMGILTTTRMRKWRKYAILMMFIVAALLTPPDVFSQTLMAGPMIILYEISVFIVAMVQKQKEKEKALHADSEETEESDVKTDA